jgi:hypothetical protein
MDVLQHLGIDLGAVAEDFKGAVAGRTLIMDGDGPAYRAAATSKRLDTAIRRYQTDMLTQMFMTESQFLSVHLTASKSRKNGRHDVIATKPYQGQRKGKDKPPLLEPLRQALTLQENWLPEMNVRLHYDIEADDGMIMEAHVLKEDGVIWSDDKDLRLTPYLYYEQKLGVVTGCESPGHIRQAYTPAGSLKIEGRADKFFWCQMLMGDTADNVQGIQKLSGKLCGPAGAYEALKNLHTLPDIANFVVDGYRAINQNVIAEGWLLWLLRHPHDSFWVYAHECGLSGDNRDFLMDCARRKWRNKPEVRDE